jgi:transcription elongation factor Elf1
MVTAVASRPSVNTPPAIHREVVGFATCPSCHTEDPTMTNVAVGAGADWHCGRCGQRWDAVRLATVAAYAVWVSEQTASPDDHATHPGGDL